MGYGLPALNYTFVLNCSVMLSVCIPVYNSKIDDLIKALHYQQKQVKNNVEIIVIDDASNEKFKLHNRKFFNYVDKYVELPENVGRSRIRNMFLKYVSTPNMLFIDSDSCIDNSEYLKKYLKVLEKYKGKVIVGGSSYFEQKPDKNKILRWKYGREVESQKAERRNINPFVSFKTNNVLIPKEILKKTPFEEYVTGYGHEDTLMGFRLKKAGVGIVHIDNYVINKDLDTNEEFLAKSKEAVDSLFQILQIVDGDKEFIDDVKLLAWVRKLYVMKLSGTAKGVLNILGPFVEFALKKGIPSILLFNVFKLKQALDVCYATGACKYFKD